MPVRRVARLIVAGTLGLAALATLTVGCSSEPERSVANYCSQIEALRTIDEDLATGDPVRIQARADDLHLLQQVAPAEIEPSVAVLVGITDDFARTAGTEPTDRDQVANEVFRGRSADIAGIEAAGTAVSDYTRTSCKVDLGGSTPAGTGGAAGSSTSTGAPVTSDGGATTTTSGGGGDPAPTTTTTTTPSLLVP